MTRTTIYTFVQTGKNYCIARQQEKVIVNISQIQRNARAYGCRLRGLRNASKQVLLTAACQIIKKIATHLAKLEIVCGNSG